VTVTINGTNDAPLITTSTTAPVVTGMVHNAVQADVAMDHRFEPTTNVDATAVHATDANVNNAADMKAVVLQVQSALGGSATFADAIASVWDYLDDNYSYYDNAINKAGVLLGLVYADYLQEGGAPLLATVVKYNVDSADAGPAPDRVQSLHDNLLGAFDKASLDDKLLGGGQGGSNPAPDAALHDNLLQQIADAGLAGRPYYGGYEGTPNNALAFDQAHGLGPLASGQLTATDVEGDALTWSVTGPTTYGSMVIDPSTGAWHYTVNYDSPATRALAQGESIAQVFTATVSDSHGGTDRIDITVNVPGSNDAPTDIALDNLAVTTTTSGAVIANLSVVDPDSTSFTFVVRNPDNFVSGDLAVTGAPGNYQLVVSNPAGVGSLPPFVSITATDGFGASYTEKFALVLPVQLFAQNGELLGSYAHIQDAVNAASGGAHQYIVAGAGTYNENITIDRGVEIRGAHYGEDGTAADRGTGETVINGQWTINTTSAVTIDGLYFNNTSPSGSKTDATLAILKGGAASGHVIKDSVFYSAVPGGDTANRDDRAIFVGSSAATGSIHIEDNLITGQPGKYGTAGWGRAVWSDGNGVDLTIEDNTFENVRSGLNLDAYAPNSPAHVTDNTFTNSGTAISLGVNWSGDITSAFTGNNTFNNVDQEINLKNLASGVTFNADSTVTPITGFTDVNGDGVINDAFYITGGSAGDSITGTSFVDVIEANGGNDTIKGGAGDDGLFGGAGTDTAAYSATLTAPEIVTNGNGGWTVTTGGAEGTDSIFTTEIVQGADPDGAGGLSGRFLLVGNGGFATIQAAVDAAGAGDTIIIAAGTYFEQVNVTSKTNLTIEAATGAVVNVVAPTDVHQTSTSASGRAINALITVTNSTNVQIIGLDVDGAGHGNTVDGSNANYIGVFYRNASGGLTDVDISGVHDAYPGGNTVDGYPIQSGNQRGVGLQVDNDALLAFSMHGGSISDFQKNATVFNYATLDISGVSIVGSGAQTINAQNGIQASNSTGSISGNTVSAIGYAGSQIIYSGGLLLFHNANLDVTGNTITGTNGATPDGKIVGIYVYDSGGANNGGSITGNTISLVDIGIGVYGDIAPNAIAISGNTVTLIDATDDYAAGLDFEPTATLTTSFDVTGTGVADLIYGAAGNDTLRGLGGGDNFVYAVGGGRDVIDGGGDVDTLTVNGTSSAETFNINPLADPTHLGINIEAGSNTVVPATSGNSEIDVTAVEEIVVNLGNAGDTVIVSGDLAGTGVAQNTVTINGGTGNDTLDVRGVTSSTHIVFAGGGGADTAIFAGAFDVSKASFSAGKLNYGSETLTGVEVLQFTGTTVLIVDNNATHYDGAYGSITAALAAANSYSGSVTILVAPGTYNENLTIGRENVSIVGMGDSTVIHGTFKADNGLAEGASVANFLQTATSYHGQSGTGVTINADHVSLSNLKITGFLNGVGFGDGTDYASLTGVTIDGTVEGIVKATTVDISHLTVTGGTISDGYTGVDFTKTTVVGQAGDGLATNIVFDGTHFSHLDAKGIYVEALSDSRITNVTMDDVGQFGRGPTFGLPVGSTGNGININLKNGSYSNIEIDHFTLTNTGSSNGGQAGPTGTNNGGAIVIEARDDGATYGAAPATATNVTIHDGSINGTSTGVQVGEPGKTNAGPDVTITNVSIASAEHNADHGDVANVTGSVTTVNLSGNGDSFVASPTSTGVLVINGLGGDDSITGGGGNDRITGGAGSDTILGGAGRDTAIYATALTVASFSFDTATLAWVVTAGAEGIDHLQGVEVATDGTHRFLLVGAGGYAHIQDAIDAALPGDTILVAPGIYSESHTTASGAAGLYIDTADLSLFGFSSLDGQLITSAADAQLYGPTVIAAAQNNFGANHWIDDGGTNTVISGLHLQAGSGTNNKLLEIMADNVTITHDFIDVNNASGYSGAAAIYLDEGGNAQIASYLIDGNILNDGIYVASGVGTASAHHVSTAQQITNNHFVGTADATHDTYDMVAVQGYIPGIGWQPYTAELPTISGNTQADNSVPFLFRMTEANPALFPSAEQVADIVAHNTSANTTYAYLLNSLNEVDTAPQDYGAGPFQRFYLANSIETLNLGADTTSDAIYSGQRIHMDAGDQLIVQSGAGSVNSTIVADGLTVIASANSVDLNLTLGTAMPDGTPVAVQSLTLGDYDAVNHLGANVDVTGNNLDNAIIGNSGVNILTGGAGHDTLTGGGGGDRFAYAEVGAANADSILDYNFGQGDVIDLSAILGEGSGADPLGGNINDYVRLTQNGSDILVQVDANGTNNGPVWSDVTTLQGYGTSNADIVRIAFQGQEHQLQA